MFIESFVSKHVMEDYVIKNKINLTITVPSPGLPGQRFMMLDYRVPVFRNQRCSGLTAH